MYFKYAKDGTEPEKEEKPEKMSDAEKLRQMREALCQYDMATVKFLLAMMAPSTGGSDDKKVDLFRDAMEALREASHNGVKLQMKLFPKEI